MKNSIPSDVWEKKKDLIASLYKDEEWPLKQVIKKIRSDDFNPSETQLRSRLKKWRVTKPSRQTRKKSHEETTGEDSGREEGSPKNQSNVSPKSQTRSQLQRAMTKISVTEPEWYISSGVYEQHGLHTAVSLGASAMPNAWAPASTHQSSLSPVPKSRGSSHDSLVIPTPASYDQSHAASPLVDGILLNQTPSMTSAFSDPAYPINAESCMQTPVTGVSAPPIQWSLPQWYPMPIEAGTRTPPVPYYTAAPLSPPIDPMMHLLPPHGSQQVTELREGARAWKRNMSVPYGSENPGHIRVHREGRVPKPLERKTSLPSKITTNQPSVRVVTPTSPYFSHTVHSAMCSPAYTYSGPEHILHRPPSIEF